MGKKIIIALLICIVGLTSAFAEGTGFVLDSFDTNGDVLIGFFPTYITSGSRFSMPELIDGNNTDLSLITGGGYTQRQLWREADGTIVSYTDAQAASDDVDNRKFNAITGEWKILFEQGVFWNEATNDDLITMMLGYKGRFERYQENVDGTASYFFDGASTVYTEAEDEILSNTLSLGFNLDTVVSEKVTVSGFDVTLSADYAPIWMLNEVLGDGVDYYSAMLNVEGYFPLMQIKNDDESKNLFAMFIADRIRVDYIDGNAVPVYAQKYPSLGHKMRGFESYSYATSLTAVNNFDLRLTGPEIMSGIFPRAAIFVDTGYYMGHYLNDATPIDGELLLSGGGEFALSIVDFLNFGIRANMVLMGDPLTEESFSTDIFMVLHY